MQPLPDHGEALCRACIETNLDTRMVIAVPDSTSAAEFREKIRQSHNRNFPELGDVFVQKMMLLLHGTWFVFSEGTVGVLARGDARYKVVLETDSEKRLSAGVKRQPAVERQKTVESTLPVGQKSSLACDEEKRYADAEMNAMGQRNGDEWLESMHEVDGPVSSPRTGCLDTAKDGVTNADNKEQEVVTGIPVQEAPDKLKPLEAPVEQAVPETSIGEAIPETTKRKRGSSVLEVPSKKVKLDTINEEEISLNAGTGTSRGRGNSREQKKKKSAVKAVKAASKSFTLPASPEDVSQREQKKNSGERTAKADVKAATGSFPSQTSPEDVSPRDPKKNSAERTVKAATQIFPLPEDSQRSADSNRPVDLRMSHQNVDDVCDRLITQHFSDSTMSPKSPKKKTLSDVAKEKESSSRTTDKTSSGESAGPKRKVTKSLQKAGEEAKQQTITASGKLSSSESTDAKQKETDTEQQETKSARREVEPVKQKTSDTDTKQQETKSARRAVEQQKTSDIAKPKQKTSENAKPKQLVKPSAESEKTLDKPAPKPTVNREKKEESSSTAAESSEESEKLEEQLPKGKHKTDAAKSESTAEASESSESETETTKQKSERPTETRQIPEGTTKLEEQKRPLDNKDVINKTAEELQINKTAKYDRQPQVNKTTKAAPRPSSSSSESSEYDSSSESESSSKGSPKKTTARRTPVDSRFQHILKDKYGLDQLIKSKLFSKPLEETVVFETQDLEQEPPVEQQQAGAAKKQTPSSTKENKQVNASKTKQHPAKDEQRGQHGEGSRKQPEDSKNAKKKDVKQETVSKSKQSHADPKLQVEEKRKEAQENKKKQGGSAGKKTKASVEQSEAKKKTTTSERIKSDDEMLEDNNPLAIVSTPAAAPSKKTDSVTTTNKRKSNAEEESKSGKKAKTMPAPKAPLTQPSKYFCSICGMGFAYRSSTFYRHKKLCTAMPASAK